MSSPPCLRISSRCSSGLSSAPIAAAKPPRATVVVPLVARPLVAAAPPPTIKTSVLYRLIGMSSCIGLWCLVLRLCLVCNPDERVDAKIGERLVIDMQRHFLELRLFEPRLECIEERPVLGRIL